jgi:TRAP-type C4-dicarboxylate transport system permease small subunit
MSGALRAAGRALDIAMIAFATLAVGIVVALVVSVCLEVVMRYFFGVPTRWVVEFSEYALLWLAFLAAAWILREEGHVKVEMLVEALPRGAQRALHVIVSLVAAGVCALFCWVSASYVLEVYGTGEILFRSVHVPKWAVMAVMPPGLALLALQCLRRAFRRPPAPATAGI